MTTVERPADVAQPREETPPEPLTAAKAPLRPGVITAAGVLLALGLLGLGVVALHDALIATGLVAGPAWIDSAIAALDRAGPAPWMVPAGILLVLLGLWALVVAVRPRPSTGVALAARTGVYLRPQDVARIARAAIDDVDDVAAAKVKATRRTVSVSVSARGTETAQVAADARAAVAQVLRALAVAPQIRVRVTSVGGPR
jgi:hypothetical protein